MKIAIDIRRMNEFGVGTYTRNVIRALARLDRTNEYFLLGQSQKVTEVGPLPTNFRPVSIAAHDSLGGFLQFTRRCAAWGAMWFTFLICSGCLIPCRART